MHQLHNCLLIDKVPTLKITAERYLSAIFGIAVRLRLLRFAIDHLKPNRWIISHSF